MGRLTICFLFSFFFSGLTSLAQSSIEKVAWNMAKHKHKKVYRCFDEVMKSKISEQKLVEIWNGIETVSGQLIAVEEVQETPKDGNILSQCLLKFEAGAYKLQVSFDSNEKIAGLFVSVIGYTDPPYARGLVVGRKNISFVSDSYTLSGELMTPRGCDNCPLVILVHGSGPNDRDETVGPNKVFLDLAYGLAAQGVASFRYDKRFKIYPELMQEAFDLDDETINDAISAYYQVIKDSSYNFGSIYFLGHSLGAFSIPLITDSLKQLDGGIILAAPTRRLEDLITYQMHYLTGLDGNISEDEQQVIEENEAKAAVIRSGQYSDTTQAKDLLAYWPGLFWRSIENYDPVKAVKYQDQMDFLILQGEKDYQVPMDDFQEWKDSCVGLANVRLISYPGLTHLFTYTTNENPGPQDYFLPKSVSELMITDLVEWIHRH